MFHLLTWQPLMCQLLTWQCVAQVWASPYQVAHVLAVATRLMDTVPLLMAVPDAPQAATVAAQVHPPRFILVKGGFLKNKLLKGGLCAPQAVTVAAQVHPPLFS